MSSRKNKKNSVKRNEVIDDFLMYDLCDDEDEEFNYGSSRNSGCLIFLLTAGLAGLMPVLLAVAMFT